MSAPARTRGGGGRGEPKPSVRLGFGGDAMLGRGVTERHRDAPPGAVWGDALPRLEALDGLFLNLECCVSARGTPTPGRTYHFRADPEWSLPALRRGGVAWVSLANNHLLDFGPEAFRDTLEHLDAADVAHSGAGTAWRAAIEPALVSAGGLEVALVSVTDQAPAYAAGPDSPGTAFLPLSVADPSTVAALERALTLARRRDPDLVVASLHWGPNWVRRPAGRYRRLAHWLARRTDLVHGHSAHVFQAVEVHRGTPILHDCGDFVDDYRVHEHLHNDRSFLFEVEADPGGVRRVRLVPTEIADSTVTLAEGEVAAWARAAMRRRSGGFGTAFRRPEAGEGLVVRV